MLCEVGQKQPSLAIECIGTLTVLERETILHLRDFQAL